MSELRKECYKCLTNQSCPSLADYGSIVCMTHRKFEMPVNKENDSVYAIKFATLQKQIDEKDKKIEELEREIRKLETAKYANQYGGTDYIHFITKEKLVTIDTNRYFIEIEEGKFVDLKQVYLDNKNSIPIQKIKDKIEELKNEKNRRVQLGIFIFKDYENQHLLGEISSLKELLEESENE